MNSLGVWLRGLASVAISGAASGIAAVFVAPETFAGDWNKLGQLALAGAVIGLANYLKQSPLPPKDPNVLPRKY